MIRSIGPLRALPSPSLQLDSSGAPFSAQFSDSYFSRDGGDAESQHVFLAGSDLAARMANTGCPLLTVAELGFGTGLNFLSTWALFRRHAAPGQRLHYWSIDAFPLRHEQLRRSLQPWSDLSVLAETMSDAYPPPVAGVHRRLFDGGRVVMDYVWSDAEQALDDLASFGRGFVDAWFLDGFAPARNKEMWAPALFDKMAQCSRPQATVASYTAAGSVRRQLDAAGFTVTKRPGYGSKRECISGRLRATQRQQAVLTPWDFAENSPSMPPASALVIGAGLAGTHAAAALARRGVKVTVLEAHNVAAAASGNPQGVLFTRLSHQRSTLGDFSLLAHGYAAALYAGMFREGSLRAGVDGHLGGCFQMPGPRGNTAALDEILSELPELAIPFSATQAALKLGVQPSGSGWWQNSAGWLSPPAVCHALLQHPDISLRENCGTLSLRRSDDRWQAIDSAGQIVAEATTAVIAAGTSSLGLLNLEEWLPLKPVRGQTTLLDASALPPLHAALCHNGYIAPASNGYHCIGATFAPGDGDCTLRTEDHRHNLQELGKAIPEWESALAATDVRTLSGRAELRAATPDYLPMVGPIPDHTTFRERFSPLAFDAQHTMAVSAPCLPHCFLSTGFGSRGLSYAALGSELLASQICGEISPLARELARSLSPARFLVRALVRGKTQALAS